MLPGQCLEEAATQLARDSLCFHGPASHHDPGTSLAAARAAVARAHCPSGVLRQAEALVASPDHHRLLPGITAPTLVIHGTHDPCIPLHRAREVSKLVPAARLLTLPGIGHELCDNALDMLLPGLQAHLHFHNNVHAG